MLTYVVLCLQLPTHFTFLHVFFLYRKRYLTNKKFPFSQQKKKKKPKKKKKFPNLWDPTISIILFYFSHLRMRSNH